MSSSSSSEQKPVMSIRAVVDKVAKKVVYVESNQDFVDVLFSFLTLPIGTIIRLMEQKSNSKSCSSSPTTVIMRCMNNLYKSVLNLDAKEHLETEECKTMLLFPRRPAESACLNLKLNIDEREPTLYYTCDVHSDRISYSKRSLCDCTSSTQKAMVLQPSPIKDVDRQVFMKIGSYIIDDHMNVQTASSMDSCISIIDDHMNVQTASSMVSCISLLDICGITDWKRLEERTLNIGLDEVLLLLKCTLLSHEPLTDIILRKGETLKAGVKTESKNKIQHPTTQETVSEATDNKVTVTVVVRKSNNQVLYAIAKADFIDLLFSFLTFPIGSIVKLCGRSSSILCIDNLYKSVGDLSIERKSGLEGLLVSPMLNAHFGCEKNKLLRVEEKERSIGDRSARNKEPNKRKMLKLMNPKCADRKETTGGGFVKGSSTFMVTNDLVVTPLCFTSGLFLLKQLNVPLNDVEERTVSIGEQEALNLLKASLVTDTALSSILALNFLAPKKEVD